MHGQVIVDRSGWGRLRISGSDRVRFLQGLTTVNVEQLADGAHGWGAILNPKGRVLSVINIVRLGDAFVIACEPELAEKTRAILERYAVMDDVSSRAIELVAHQCWTDATSAWTAPITQGPAPGPVASADDAEIARIEAGHLRYGVDVDADCFPFETPLAALLDYGKGCYVGQEPVFRVHAQGNSARILRGLVIEGDGPLPAEAKIQHAQKDNAGVVTSSVVEGSTTIALGYLHRTVWDPGGSVVIAGRTATVYELPWT